MKFAINVPNFGPYASARLTAQLAADAEAAGWDGFHVWDHIHAETRRGIPTGDPWILLAAVALATSRIRIGTMVTPLARRRPWKVARETVTLDHLSAGRLTLGVGLGFPPELEFAALGEISGERERAERLDEGLAVLTALWSGRPVNHGGKHYQLHDVQFLPKPLQEPRIPIWVARLSGPGPLRRAARWDGVVPLDPTQLFPTPEQVADIVAETQRYREPTAGPLDVLIPLLTTGDRDVDRAHIREHEEAGVTWGQVGALSLDDLRRVIAAGPRGH